MIEMRILIEETQPGDLSITEISSPFMSTSLENTLLNRLRAATMDKAEEILKQFGGGTIIERKI